MKIFGRTFFERKTSDTKLTVKAAGFSGGTPFAYINDQVPYSIGDSAKNYVTNGYDVNPLVYGAITKITTTASKCHFKLMDCTDPDNKEEIKDHPILDLLRRPNPLYGKREFIGEAVAFKELTGECFILKDRLTVGARKGQVANLVIMPPQYINIIQDKISGMPTEFKYKDGNNTFVMQPEDVIFMRYFNPDGSIRGVSPLKAARQVIAQSNDMYTTNRKLVGNAGPAGILAIDPDTNQSVDWNETQIDQLQERFRERYTGPQNAGGVLISEGKFQWVATGLTPEDLMLKEGQRMNLRDICNVYGFSSQILNDPENKTYSNMLQAAQDFIKNCVAPKMHLFVDALNRNLVSEWNKMEGKTYMLELDLSVFEELSEDEEAQATMLATAWWMTINEKREAMHLEPLSIPEGDDIYVPTTMLPVSTKSDSQMQLLNAHLRVQQVMPTAPKQIPPTEPEVPEIQEGEPPSTPLI